MTSGEPVVFDAKREVAEKVERLNSATIEHPRSDCPICNGKGYIGMGLHRENSDYFGGDVCACVAGQTAHHRAERAGLEGALAHFSFDTYVTDTPWRAEAAMKARAYALKPEGWLVITGPSGTGKTHLCTAACRELLKQGRTVRREEWRTIAPRLKNLLSSDYARYERELKSLCTVSILYVDDFFKGTISDADVNLAYTLLNDRYNAMRPTILSTELSLEEILSIDEAIGSRIYERSRGFLIKTPPGNQRLKRPAT